MEINPLYSPFDLENTDFERDIGYPGEFPYTRGVHRNLYRGRLWTMRQFSGFASPEETNRRYHYLLKNGQNGLSVAFDMPTLMGYDSDDPISLGEVGRCGVAVDTLADMEVIFKGIPLDKISTSMTINGPAPIFLAMYIAVAQKQGVPIEKIRGTLQNDILKEYIAQKEWIFPPEPSMKLIVDTIEYGMKHTPKWNTVSISGYHIREAGANAVQELAFTLADGFAYVEAAIERGMDVDSFAPRLSFFFNSHNNFFEEIAKFRAARRIWAKRMKEKYGAKDPKSLMLRFHTQTAGCTLTAQQPENNIIRVAYQAMAASLGGTQSLHTNSMDETLSLPTEKAVKISLRTQQVLAHETGVTDTVDPLAGSYYVENLTGRMEEECEKYFTRIEHYGGVIEAIKKGFFQREIAHSAYMQQKKIDKKEDIIVGVNEFVDKDEDIEIQILKIDPHIEEKKVKELKELKSSRDQDVLKEKLDRIKQAAQNDENLMYSILDAVNVYASMGEIVQALKEVYGTYREPVIF
ncbi:MAG: methylmalonyl-CoA mutase [Candidatus Eremiobacteraeota bacterium]|nr:methylmalonyl-CoA mutase [Candidatus Eremiobacteraeota bacterium]